MERDWVRELSDQLQANPFMARIHRNIFGDEPLTPQHARRIIEIQEEIERLAKTGDAAALANYLRDQLLSEEAPTEGGKQ